MLNANSHESGNRLGQLLPITSSSSIYNQMSCGQTRRGSLERSQVSGTTTIILVTPCSFESVTTTILVWIGQKSQLLYGRRQCKTYIPDRIASLDLRFLLEYLRIAVFDLPERPARLCGIYGTDRRLHHFQ